MENSKIILLLRTFSSKMRRRFREYLASPFFNKRDDLQKLYATLEKLLSQTETPERSEVWNDFAPHTPQDNKQLDYLLSFLFQHAENFLAIEAAEADKVGKGIAAMQYFSAQGLEKLYKGSHRRTQKKLEGSEGRGAEWQLLAWRFTDAEVQHFYRSKTRKANASLNKSVFHLDNFYLNKKLEITSEHYNLSRILQENYEAEGMDDLLHFAHQQSGLSPTVEVRMLVLDLLRNPDSVESFYALRAWLPRISEIFPPDKVKGIFAYAQNFCIRSIKAGSLEFQEELFWIYEESLRAGLMYEDGQLSPWNFKNVVSIALRLGKWDWVERFIEAHETRIPEDFRESAIAYNRANLHFHRGEFGEVLRSLQSVEFTDIFFALDTRRMLLMVYYERDDSEAFRALVAAFRTFLSRNKLISATNKLAYKNFVDGLLAVFRARENGEGQQENLLKKLQSTSPMVEKDWVLEKVYAL